MSDVTLLGIAQTVSREIGLPVPSTVVGTTTQQVAQLVAFANVTGDALRDDVDWPALRQTATITTINGTSIYTVTPNELSGTFTCNRIVAETGWDTTNRWYFVGSVNDMEWAAWQNGVITTPIRRIWRTRSDSTIEVFPVPSEDGDSLQLSTVANEWARSGSSAPQKVLSADTDTHLFNDRVFLLGVKWRFLEAKGLPFAAPLAQYETMLGVRRAAARPARTLSMDSRRARIRRFIDYRNVPDSGLG